MDARSAEDSAQLPAALQRAAPRDVRLTIGGVVTVAAAVALVITGVVSELVLYRRAKISEEHVSLFMSERRFAGAVLATCGLVAVILVYVVRRQSLLLTNGRAAVGVIRRIDKKKSDKGAYWHVEYEFTLLSGATRAGHYNHSGKHPPQIGSTIVIVHDRDNPERRARYPFSLVKPA